MLEPDKEDLGDYLSLSFEKKEGGNMSVGRLSTFLAKSISDSLPIFESIYSDIETLAGYASTLGDLKGMLFTQFYVSPDASVFLYERKLVSSLGGILWAMNMEGLETPDLEGSKVPQLPAFAAKKPKRPFFDIPPADAIRLFQAREILDPASYARLDDLARREAFTASGLMTAAIRETAFREIDRALTDGTGLREFRQSLERREIQLGITPSDPTYIENVFRTNINQAYTEGKREVAFSEASKRLKPYVLYRPIADDRHYGNGHDELEGVCIAKENNPPLPPFLYQCRCGWNSVSEEEVEEEGYTILDSLPDSVETF